MTITDIIQDKGLKPKQKTEILGSLLINGQLSTETLLAFASKAKDPARGTCIEALEWATREDPGIADEQCLLFVTDMLTAKAPRVQWESAKVIGHIASRFPKKLKPAISHLLLNAESTGTVVRWSAAYALGQIMLHCQQHRKELLPVIENLCHLEENNGVKKQYLTVIKQIKPVK